MRKGRRIADCESHLETRNCLVFYKFGGLFASLSNARSSEITEKRYARDLNSVLATATTIVVVISHRPNKS